MGGYQASQGTVVEAIPALNLSGAPDADPDGIWDSANGATVTYNKTGTGHSTPARKDLVQLADGESVTFVLKHGAVTDATTLAKLLGVYSTLGGTFAVGLNAQGGGVAQVITWDGAAHGYVGIYASQHTIKVTMTRHGGTVYVNTRAEIKGTAGAGFTAVTLGTASFSVSGDVWVSFFAALNDNSGGSLGAVPYAGSFAVQPEP